MKPNPIIFIPDNAKFLKSKKMAFGTIAELRSKLLECPERREEILVLNFLRYCDPFIDVEGVIRESFFTVLYEEIFAPNAKNEGIKVKQTIRVTLMPNIIPMAILLSTPNEPKLTAPYPTITANPLKF